MNLRDNSDGTCNCRPLDQSCFFTSASGDRCDCKCHMTPKTTESWEERFDKEFVGLFSDAGEPHWDAGIEAFNRGENWGEKRKAFIKQFIAAEKKLSYLEALEDVEKILAGMKLKEEGYGIHWEQKEAAITRNKALSEALTQVENLKELGQKSETGV